MKGFAAIAFAGAIVFAAPAAHAQSEGEITALLDRWTAAYATATDGTEMLGFYHPDAVFWGTTAPQPFVGPAEIEPYFQIQFDNYATRHVEFVDPVIRVIGDAATATGYALFDVATVAGQRVQAMLRFTLAFVRTADGWLIVQQHSSQLAQ